MLTDSIERCAGPAIAAPRPDKPPMSANLFDRAAGANVMLMPMFPYEGPGDIVPCVVARQTRAGENHGVFWHENTVDELMICFGGNGRVRTGEVRVGAKTHGVGGGAAPSDSFTVNCVTQRQLESGEQMEAMVLLCEQCNQPVLRHEFSGQPTETTDDGFHELPTLAESFGCVETWNSDAAVRACKNCGHVNEPFPVQFWGWDVRAMKARVAQEAARLLQEAGSGR